MFYDIVDFIFDELDTLSVENKLTENLRLIAYSCESSKPEDIKKYFRAVLDRVWQLSKSKDNNYSLYISSLVLSFLKELKLNYPNIFNEKDFFKNISLFFSYIEIILKKSEQMNETTKQRKKEIISILRKYFSEEYYYRKNRRLVPKQYNLPF